ncbi:FKBP-type peptidyl-prolyl cis-trans isomerase [Microbacteriaceae bacterium VKM Ac-2855]|nr:FKBP-type peptidyl-prolyl cis-trans isomerase [Microbacteriaceae bacterium VKM Ac-2855]
MRRTAALIATVGLVAALSACSGSGSDTSQADCSGGFASGSVSNQVEASGDFGEKPDVTIPTPLNATTSETTQLIEGEGAPIEKGALLTMDYTLLNGTTGDVLETTGYDGTDAGSVIAGGTSIPGLADGVLCATVDSRIAIVIAPEDGFGDQAQQLGLTADDTLVLVADIVSASLARANGADQVPQNNVPTVTLDENGVPGIAKQDGTPPTTLKKATLKKGDGAVVGADDAVIVNYTGWLWATGKTFDSSWEKGSPVALTPSSTVPGFADALTGATVGSQIEVVIPPDQGYGDTESGAVPAGSTLIFVVDVLGIQ